MLVVLGRTYMASSPMEVVVGKGKRIRARRLTGAALTPSVGSALGLQGHDRTPGRASRGRETADVAVITGLDDDRVRLPQPWARRDAGLADLRQLAEQRREARRTVSALDAKIVHQVARLRLAGATWVQVGAALGVSRQAAQQRFGAGPSCPTDNGAQ
jgi:hypothetical protein